MAQGVRRGCGIPSCIKVGNMSFFWWIEDKEGNDLLAGCNKQMIGLGYNHEPDTGSPFSVFDIRQRWAQSPYKDKLADAARDGFLEVQQMLRNNLESLKPHHDCPCCSCQSKVPVGWSVDEINKVLAIDPTKVWRAGGGW